MVKRGSERGMLIRSQDKRLLVTLNNVVNIMVQPDNSIMALYGFEHGWDTLGDYSTEARAIKVLDMIQQAYESSCEIDAHIPGDTPYMRVYNTVFQMPQDKEVSEG